MIITWMFGSAVFALLVALAASAGERAIAALGGSRRLAWTLALAAATAWPLVAGATFVVRLNRPASHAPVAATSTASTLGRVAARMPRMNASVELWIDRAAVVLWAMASLGLLARIAVGIARLRRMERTAALAELEGVQVLVTESTGPAVYGVVNPRIVVPRWITDLDPPLRALVLRHEDQHRRRGDAAVTLAGALATALVPWNPAVWTIARRLRLAVELDCDGRVVGTDGDPTRYGKLLLLVAQRQTHTGLVPMLAESNANLQRRIEAMNESRKGRHYLRGTVFGGMAVAAVFVACSAPVMNDVTAPQPMSAAKLSGLPAGEKVFFEFQVQKPVTQTESSARPRYPDILRQAGVEGEVLAQFVVDTSGQPMPGSLKILKASHELFAQSVRAAFPGMRFTPAQVGGHVVRQLVQAPYVFAVASPAVSPTRADSAAAAMRKGGVLELEPTRIKPTARP